MRERWPEKLGRDIKITRYFLWLHVSIQNSISFSFFLFLFFTFHWYIHIAILVIDNSFCLSGSFMVIISLVFEWRCFNGCKSMNFCSCAIEIVMQLVWQNKLLPLYIILTATYQRIYKNYHDLWWAYSCCTLWKFSCVIFWFIPSLIVLVLIFYIFPYQRIVEVWWYLAPYSVLLFQSSSCLFATLQVTRRCSLNFITRLLSCILLLSRYVKIMLFTIATGAT